MKNVLVCLLLFCITTAPAQRADPDTVLPAVNMIQPLQRLTDTGNHVFKQVPRYIKDLYLGRDHTQTVMSNQRDTFLFFTQGADFYLQFTSTRIYRFPRVKGPACCLEKISALEFTDVNADGFTDLLAIQLYYRGYGNDEVRYATEPYVYLALGSDTGFSAVLQAPVAGMNNLDTIKQALRPGGVFVVFSEDENQGEDWNAKYNEIKKHYAGTNTQVIYLNPGETELEITDAWTGRKSDLGPYLKKHGQGYLVLIGNKTPLYLGDHGGFYTGDEKDDPIKRADVYLGR